METGVRSNESGLYLVAHGPFYDHASVDSDYLWNSYFPQLKATVDTCRRMRIQILTIHYSVDGRFVRGCALTEKTRALNELVEYAGKAGVLINLENVTESAHDLEMVVKAVPGLGITLDVGHAELAAPGMSCEIINRLGSSIRHIHLHDNFRGGPENDLHLPIGEGHIDFEIILRRLAHMSYNGAMTLEIPFKHIERSKELAKKWISEST
jgi:sugar phosphate isomerase/epimerase